MPGTVAFACTGVPAHATCTVNPSAGALGGTSTVSVTVATSVAGAALHWPGERKMVWLVGMLPLGLLGLGRRRWRRLVGAAVLCGVVMMAGCGASRLIPSTGLGGGTVSPTPSGTYNLTVSGTSAGMTRSVGLTLIVQ